MNTQKTDHAAPAKKASSTPLLASLAVVFVIAMVILGLNGSSTNEAGYGGKSLSEWLVEVDYWQPEASRKAGREAIQQMGTNALPFVFRQFRKRGSQLTHYLNLTFAKVPSLKFRFATADQSTRRATWGFDALGSAAKPAIPELLALLQEKPGYVPSALAGIGVDAIPALQRCLTNTSPPFGQYIPGNTIGAIFNAVSSGKIPRQDARVFLPEIEAWARSTNAHAAWYATNYVGAFAR